ncbi:CBS domain-containing protein [Wenjunlia tyrosinilytica]|uniref:BON domain-containing protein n=1 Tax=Wenjunlia tyrosinilytica TaxID=1544741 RepID=A0A918DZL8_9ACTN|nr:CBS domain-containing protein [Wenjunlia tyrosinilytica]GGO90488.1 hypothetical protein GCM10012280_36160 [Wenjunlia tyrosinilytica]
MQHRTVRDLMTHAVVRVQPRTSFKEVAELLHEYDITAVPVVDADDRPLGVVSEADLLRKTAGHPLDTAPSASGRAGRARPGATVAEELMSSPAVCARPGWTVVQAAQVMQENHIKRLPVIDDTDRLVGVVSRSDLLRVFLRKDDAIRAEIVEDVVVRTLGEAPSTIGVTVDHGKVVLSGSVCRKGTVPVLVRLCEAVDGVISVDERLGWELDDAGSGSAPAPAAGSRYAGR